MSEFDGKLFLISGVPGGLFRDLVAAAAIRGGKVAAVSRKGSGVVELAREIGSAVEPFEADLADPGEAGRIVAEVAKKHGGIDALVQVAGSICGSRNLVDIGPEEWEEVVGRSLRRAFETTRAAAAVMAEQRSGSIRTVILHAGAGFHAFGGPQNRALNGGLVGFSRRSGTELAPLGISVESFGLSLVLGTQASGPLWEYYDGGRMEAFLSDTPVGRIVSDREAANEILASVLPRKERSAIGNIFNQFGFGI